MLPSPRPPRHGDPLIQNTIKNATVMLGQSCARHLMKMAREFQLEIGIKPLSSQPNY